MTEVRAATAADAARLADIFVAAWRHGYRGVVPDDVIDALDPAEYAAAFAERIARPGSHTAVAVDEVGHPIGFAGYEPDTEHPGDGYLASLYVHPAAQRRRRGPAVAASCHRRDAGRRCPAVGIRAERAARALYEAAGFRADGAPSYRSPVAHAPDPVPAPG